jgi:hypothetical protein
MEGLCPVLDPHPLSTKSFRISTLWILFRKFKNATRCDEEVHLLGLRWIVDWGMLWASWSMAASGRPGHRGVEGGGASDKVEVEPCNADFTRRLRLALKSRSPLRARWIVDRRWCRKTWRQYSHSFPASATREIIVCGSTSTACTASVGAGVISHSFAAPGTSEIISSGTTSAASTASDGAGVFSHAFAVPATSEIILCGSTSTASSAGVGAGAFSHSFAAPATREIISSGTTSTANTASDGAGVFG